MIRFGLAVGVGLALGAGAEPQVRCRNFLVNPSTGPVGEVEVAAAEAWSGRVALAPPEGWRIEPAAFEVALPAAGSTRLSYRVVKARENAANAYPFAVSVAGAAARTQTVRVASAPYGRAKVDGRLGDEWRDAIPLRFETGGLATTVRVFWDEEALTLSAEVEERALSPAGKAKGASGRHDALQLWLGASAGAAERHEFLVEPVTASRAVCRRLAGPGAAEGAAEVPGARAAVRHSRGVTVYEVALPLEALQGVRADAGREFAFSLLVHDPDGAGLRDLGAALNRPEAERRAPPARWTLWPGGCWAGAAPYDGGSEFGFCSSVH